MLSTMSSGVQHEEERVFKYYLKLLPDIRTKIINEMCTADKCRFIRCSKLCLSEVEESNVYIHGLHFWCFHINVVTISVTFHSKNDSERMGFSLKFIEDHTNKLIEYTSVARPHDVLWKIQFQSEIGIRRIALDYFQICLQYYQKTIRRLILCGSKNYKFAIKSLDKLEELSVDNHEQFLKYTSRMKHPLKGLTRFKTQDNLLPSNCEKLFEIQDWFHAPDMKMDNDHFLKFNAKRMSIHIGELTPIHLFCFIKSWQNGKIRKNFEFVEFKLDESDFDTQQFFLVLGLEYDGSETQEFEIKHNTEVDQIGYLSHSSVDGKKKIIFDANCNS